MTHPVTVVMADAGEVLFWIIVAVITVISQIAKAKQKRSQPSPPPLPGDDAVNPQDELRRFLESLAEAKQTGTAEAVPVPARPPQSPPPVMRPRHVAPVVSRLTTAAQISRPSLRTTASATVVRPAPAAQKITPLTTVQRPPVLPFSAGEMSTAREFVLGKDAGSAARRHALQRAFVLQEVFGPALALRHHAAASSPPALQ